MPLRVNYSGVMPIIFASVHPDVSAADFQLAGERFKLPFLHEFFRLADAVQLRLRFYLIALRLMILFFSYFWVATQFNEIQIADD
jgi:preprotein translocase subunit SecY